MVQVHASRACQPHRGLLHLVGCLAVEPTFKRRMCCLAAEMLPYRLRGVSAWLVMRQMLLCACPLEDSMQAGVRAHLKTSARLQPLQRLSNPTSAWSESSTAANDVYVHDGWSQAIRFGSEERVCSWIKAEEVASCPSWI
jgi:hypothetical protein